jgi:hypothetical protein
VRQRDVGDGGVEHLHERRQHDAHGHEPRAVPWMPVLVMCAIRHGLKMKNDKGKMTACAGWKNFAF